MTNKKNIKKPYWDSIEQMESFLKKLKKKNDKLYKINGQWIYTDGVNDLPGEFKSDKVEKK